MMEFDRKEIELALSYAEFTDFKASLDNHGQIIFTRSPLPEGLGDEMVEEISFVADYYQRMIFNGDLEPDTPDLTMPEFDDPIEEINFKLKRYQSEFSLELRKTLGVEDHRTINPYARVMLEFAADQEKAKKK